MMMLGFSISRRLERTYRVFTGNGTFTVPGTAYAGNGFGKLEVTTLGGGGGGGGGSMCAGQAGNGGGGFVNVWSVVSVTPNASYPITVGGGGYPGNGAGATGYTGGSSSFSSLLSSGGGFGGGVGFSGGGSGVADLGAESASYTGYRYVSGGGGGYAGTYPSRPGQGGTGGSDFCANVYLPGGTSGAGGLVIVRWDA